MMFMLCLVISGQTPRGSHGLVKTLVFPRLGCPALLQVGKCQDAGLSVILCIGEKLEE